MSEEIGFTLSQLDYFVAVAECGSVSAAAQELHVSQSALSASVMKLERQLAVQLFIRSPSRKITLSPDGHALLGEARSLLRQARDVTATTRMTGTSERGSMSLGCFLPLAPVCVPLLMHELRRRDLDVYLDLIEGDVETLHRAVTSGSCEVALAYLLRPLSDIDFEVVRDMRFHAVVAEGHPLAARGEVTLAELSRYPWIRFNIPESVQVMELLLLEAGIMATTTMTSTSIATIRSLVGASDGFALLTMPWATELTATGDRVVRLEIKDLRHRLQMVLMTVPGRRPSRRTELLKDALRTVALQL